MDVRATEAQRGTPPPGPRGLSAAEAEDRRRRGEGNAAVSRSSRSYAQILRTNVFSSFNLILFAIGVALLALGRVNDAVVSVGLGLVNAAISAVQEIRAKRKLDRLQLLSRSTVTVVRDGRDVEVVPEEVVRGDVLHVRPGDQVVVDGPVLEGGRVEADESLLTGESDPQVKEPGEDLLSGSSCVAGEGHQLARDVGAASYTSRLTADARQVSTDTTPLQRRITFVVRLVICLVVLMSGGGPGGADHRGAVRAGALRAVLPGRGGLHRRRSEERRPWRPGAAGQRRGVDEQRRRGLHRQDRHAHHRPAGPGRGRAGRAAVRRRRGAAGRLDGPQRGHREPDHHGAGRRAARRALAGAGGGPVLLVAAVERAAHRRRRRRPRRP
jgi:hypothetical protein